MTFFTTRRAAVAALGLGAALTAFAPFASAQTVADIKKKGVTFQTEPRALTPPSPSALKISFITGPDGVRIEVVEPPKK